MPASKEENITTPASQLPQRFKEDSGRGVGFGPLIQIRLRLQYADAEMQTLLPILRELLRGEQQILLVA